VSRVRRSPGEGGLAWPLVLVAAVLLGVFVAGGIALIREGPGEEPDPSGDGRYEIRAIGDSVTAGWGYDNDGRPIESPRLLGFCIPPRTPDGRCQSTHVRSYPAVFAEMRGVPRAPPGYRNLARAGADPADWLDPAVFGDELAAVAADDPDVTLLTLGANPLLTAFLNPGNPRGGLCVLIERPEGVRRCVEAALERNRVATRLSTVYQRLLDTPEDGKRGLVVILQYHRTVPRTIQAAKVGILFGRLRETIAEAVAAARAARPDQGERLLLVEPPDFGAHHCDVDDLDQRWVLRSDFCIHPSAAGHRALARALDEAVPEPGT
jgi:lysophospholipase L1-like esterase